jgi:hypothetical protein
MTPLRLLHLANHASRNIGNAALVLGLERVLREDLPREIEFVAEPWDLHSRGLLRFDESFVERVNRCDALLVGAAVSFDGRPIYGNTGFRFDLPLELLDRIERPIVFYGLSYRHWPARPYHHLETLRRALERLLASDRVLFTVRNDDTKQWLHSLVGISLDAVERVPDPAVYVPVSDIVHPELADGSPHVIIAPNVEDEIYRFGGRPVQRSRAVLALRRRVGAVDEWHRRRERFVAALAAVLERIVLDRDLGLLFCSHTYADLAMSDDLFRRLPEAARQRVVFAPTGLPVAAGPAFYDLYAKAALVLPMRIHAMNPAVGLRVPLVPLVSQSRMTAFMEDAGLGDLCVDIRSDDVAERLESAVAATLDRPELVRERAARAHDELRVRTRAVNRRVADLVA